MLTSGSSALWFYGKTMGYSYGENDLVTVKSCYSAVDAHVFMGLLRDNGVEASLADEANVSWYPGATSAYGGVRVMVRATDETMAKEILNAPLDVECVGFGDVPENLGQFCPTCGSSKTHDNAKITPKTIFTFIQLALLVILFGSFSAALWAITSKHGRQQASPRHWVCDVCGHEWDEA